MMARRPKASSDVSRRIPFCWLLVTLLAGATTIVMVFSSYHSNRVSSFLIGSRALSASDTVGQLCIVVRTMPAQRYALPALLLSLFSDAETRTGVRVIVIDTDTPGKPPFDDLSDIVSTVNTVIGFHGVVVSSRHQADVLSQFSQLTTPDFGYLLTDAVLEDIIAAHAHNSRASRRYAVAHVLEPRSEIRDLGWTCEAVMTTNGDNVYAAEFFRQTHTALRLNDSDAYVQAVELTPPVIASDSESSVAGSGSASGSANTRASMGPGAAEQSRTAPLPADTSTGASMVATHWCVQISSTRMDNITGFACFVIDQWPGGNSRSKPNPFLCAGIRITALPWLMRRTARCCVQDAVGRCDLGASPNQSSRKRCARDASILAPLF